MKDWKVDVEKYCEWLKTGKGKKPDLRGADLRDADLRGADLQDADLQGADLQGANLQDADLRGADLRGADLQGADLQGANLQDADLPDADLQGANLRGADLRRADLRRAYLQDADLPAPSIILLANWRELSDKTTIALMRLDCSACLNGKKRFDIWAHDGICPYNESKVQRVANFVEKKHLWKYGPPPSIYNCMKMVLDEKCPGWNKK